MRQVKSRKGRSGFTLIELLVVVAIIALLISILLPSLARARELAKRTTCAANLSGIGKGLYSYASDGNQGMPIAAHAKTTQTDQMAAGTKFVGMIGTKRGYATNSSQGEIQYWEGTPASPDLGQKMSTVRNLWVLVNKGGSTPASFTCPSSEDTKNDEDNPQAYWDFGKGDAATEGTINTTSQGAGPGAGTAGAAAGWAQVSYGYQIPWGQQGRPSADRDQRVVLVADKGPYSAFIEGGKSKPTPWSLTTITSTSSPDDWRKYNSPNHGGVGDGEGQNVLGADGHADWFNKATAGPALDNIYTRWNGANADLINRIRGLELADGGGNEANMCPLGETDAIIYP